MNLNARVDELCKALDARHTGCEIEVVGDDIRVVRTFSYASKRDLLITDVLRALTAPDWHRAIADAHAAVSARVAAYEERSQEDARAGVRIGIAPGLKGSGEFESAVRRLPTRSGSGGDRTC